MKLFEPVGQTQAEDCPLIAPSGFREYDARWWFGHPGSPRLPDLNLAGVRTLGMGLVTLLRRKGVVPRIVVGHDYRSYSPAIAQALIAGLVAGGAQVKDIGLALSPMAYFAQFALDCPAVAMVTASHNENGWTGVKMGCDRPLTFGPEEMTALRDIVLSGAGVAAAGGALETVPDFRTAYLEHLATDRRIGCRLKVVCACGNGTAGLFAPQLLEAIGCEVVPLDCDLDFTFPRYNPNPEDLAMLRAIAEAVLAHEADLGFGFDGDGDRCGVIDNHGQAIFADKIGLLLAREIARQVPEARFVVDVKSTALFATDPELARLGAQIDYWKTGHSHIKRRMVEIGAIAAFEKSGHAFFNPPFGLGYDDGLLTAITVCALLDANPGRRIADLYAGLPPSWSSPTLSPHCADAVKYDVVERLAATLTDMGRRGEPLAGQTIARLMTINGVRVTVADGTWGLIRASSNKPELAVVVESPVSEPRMREMFQGLDRLLRRDPQVGPYNQSIGVEFPECRSGSPVT